MSDTKNEYAEKRTKSITAQVTEFARESINGTNMTSVFCEYWEAEQVYVFQSIPITDNLQLAVGDLIEVFVAPDDYTNYYVSINTHIIYNKNIQKNESKKTDNEKMLGYGIFMDLYSNEEQEKMLNVKAFGIIGALLIWCMGINNYINEVVGLLMAGILVAVEQMMESKIVGKNNTSLKLQDDDFRRQCRWLYEHIYLLYAILAGLHLYCVYSYFFGEIETYIWFIFFTIGMDLFTVYFVKTEKRDKESE